MAHTLSNHFVKDIAEQLNSLAECDRDSKHYENQLMSVLRCWVRLKLPGYQELNQRIREIEQIKT